MPDRIAETEGEAKTLPNTAHDSIPSPMYPACAFKLSIILVISYISQLVIAKYIQVRDQTLKKKE